MGGSNFLDLTGQRFGRLTVIDRAPNRYDKRGKVQVMWNCICDCGTHKVVSRSSLRKGDTQSCGCYQRESMSERTKKYNNYDLSGEFGIGFTSNTNQKFYFDLEDYDKIKDYCWNEHVVMDTYHRIESYDRTTDKIVILHYVIMGSKYWDHINRNPLDNRKCNLRKATHAENAKNRSLSRNNTSGVTGVTRTPNGNWQARIRIDQQEKSILITSDFDAAVKARLEAEKKYYGEFASQKHLFEEYGIE